MNDADFALLATLLKDRSGLVIGPDKLYLLETRLGPLLRRHELPDLGSLAARIRMAWPEPLIAEIVDAMTTNETSFFRDHGPFEKFTQSILPALLQARAGQKRLRLWSAACSTGQEPYSLAMLLNEQAAALTGWRIDIVATDISDRVLERARSGVYSTFEVQRGMPVRLLMKYFEQTGNDWRLRPEIAGMVDFRKCNLLGDLRGLGQFDLVFCRNVLIYFDAGTKRRVLASIRGQMAADAYLMLGGAESMYGVSDDFIDIAGQRGVYRRAPLDANFQPAPVRRTATS